MKRLRLTIYGEVQGVFFRDMVCELATGLSVTGLVKNHPDGSVGIVAEGDQVGLEELFKFCKQGPPMARVDDVEDSWEDTEIRFYLDFKIER